jgi:hypothetical protein
MRRLWWTVAVIGVALGLGMCASATNATAQIGDGTSSVLFPKKSHPYGASLTTWAERIGQWIYGQPFDHNPAFDQTGADCAVDQGGQVWFIPPIFAPPGTPRPIIQNASRTCTIPENRALLLDMGAVVDDYPCPAAFHFEPAPGQSLYDFLIADVKPLLDSVNLLDVSLDGRPIDNALSYRYTSNDLFQIVGDVSLQTTLDPCITGGPQSAVIDGFFMMFKPLEPGLHTIVVHGTNTFGDDRTYTYHLTVQ